MTEIRLSKKHLQKTSLLPLTIINVLLTLWVCAVIVSSLFFLYKQSFDRFILMTDFPAFYTAGKLVTEGVGANFYNYLTQQDIQKRFFPASLSFNNSYYPFRNPPFYALIFVPFSFFQPSISYLLLIIGNFSLLMYFSLETAKFLTIRNPTLKMTILLLTLSFYPTNEAIVYTQPSILLALIFLKSYVLVKENRGFLTGLLLSLLLIKLQYFFIPLLSLLFARKSREVYGMLVGSTILLLISTILVGLDGVYRYVQFLISVNSWGDAYNLNRFLMQTIRGFCDVLFQTSYNYLYYPVFLSGVLITTTCLIYIWRKRIDSIDTQDIQWAGLIISTILLSPFSHLPDLCLLLVSNVLIFKWLTCYRPKVIFYFLTGLIIQYFILFFYKIFLVYTHTQVSVLFMLFTLIWLCFLLKKTTALQGH
jgi:hypothetical protein